MATTPDNKFTGAPIDPLSFVAPKDPRAAGSTKPTAGMPKATELRFGLWDNRGKLLDKNPPNEKIGLVVPFNEPSEDENFVGGDSRRFYIQVVDPGAAGQKSIVVDWWTAYENSAERKAGVVQDDPRTRTTLLELEPPPGPKPKTEKKGTGIFLSKGLMLVNDAVDRREFVNSGITAGDVKTNPKLSGKTDDRNDKVDDYRLRRAGMFSFGVASYLPKAAPAITKVVPVFLPESRRLLPVQVYVVRKSKGGAPSIPPADLAATDLRVLTETYERLGIWVWTMLPPEATRGDTKVLKVTAPNSTIEYTMLEIDPPQKVGKRPLTEGDMNTVAAAFPGAGAGTLRLFFVEDIRFGGHVLGKTFVSNFFTPPGVKAKPPDQPPASQGASFVRLGRDPYTAAHELGHNLIGKEPNGGEYVQSSTDTTNMKPGARQLAALNLMVGSRGNVETADQTKRIWDLPDDDGIDHLFLLLAGQSFLR